MVTLKFESWRERVSWKQYIQSKHSSILVSPSLQAENNGLMCLVRNLSFK